MLWECWNNFHHFGVPLHFADTTRLRRVFRALDKLGPKSIYGEVAFKGKWKIRKICWNLIMDFSSINAMKFEKWQGGDYYFEIKVFFYFLSWGLIRKYVRGFRLFHCSANKPSGWTKAGCRDEEHVRAGFRRASTLSRGGSSLERGSSRRSSRFKWLESRAAPSADEARHTTPE